MGPPADTLYLDCFSGISGDMLLAALIDAGLDPNELQRELERLPLDPLRLVVKPTKIHSIAARTFAVDTAVKQPFRHLDDLEGVLEGSTLPDPDTALAGRVFRRLAEAEAAVHGIGLEQVHFHEVGALDTIVDVVGTVIALRLLGISRVCCSPLPLGRGLVRCEHGNLPLPAPAVCALLQGVPIYGIEAADELVTPTGAALAVTLAESFGPMPPMTVSATGYGAGSRPGTPERPNLLRALRGISEQVTEAQQVEVIETGLDDWNPEHFPFLCQRLLEGGALDVSLGPIYMKKGRPGFRLQVVSSIALAQPLKELILNETTAIGLRFRREQRLTLPRRTVEVPSPWGPIKAKEVRSSSGVTVYPEYESCRAIAEQHRLPLAAVYRQVIVAGNQDA